MRAALISFAVFFALQVMGQPSWAATGMTSTTMPFENGLLQVNVGEYAPAHAPIGDILFFHGYGDRYSNHETLFHEWTSAGFRVLAFDLPSHGSTESEALDLDSLTFTDIARLASAVERRFQADASRPLILAGWSLGALIAIRMTQSDQFEQLSRPPSGLILFTPGVSVYKCVGNWACQITNETLTHNFGLYQRSISPTSPLYRPRFATHLLTNAALVWHQGIPSRLPTLTVIAGEVEDQYVKSTRLISWVQKQREVFGANIQALHCPAARHEVDNELPEFGGAQVRFRSVDFLKKLVGKDGDASGVEAGPCRDL